MKIALVHDYLKGEGGAEQVLLALHEMYPEAPIYTIFSNIGKGKNTLFEKKFAKAKIVTSWFDKLPFREKLMSPCRFLLPVIWGSFDFSEYDLVISSASWAIAKGFGKETGSPTSPKASLGALREICYCHTPSRILYGYETSRNWRAHWYIRVYAAITSHFLRVYDFNQAQKVTQFVANSQEVQKRIEKFYRRESVIIYPPVEVGDSIKYQVSSIKGRKKDNTRYKIQDTRYFLTGGRLELAKNFDVIIKACNELKLPLKIYGRGPQREYLESLAGPTVEFLGFVSDEGRQRLLAGAEAFICAATDEDFGITPVEAMAEGTPVIAYRGGGYTETVVAGVTGVFFDSLEVGELVRVMRDMWENGEKRFRPGECRKRAEEFSKEVFVAKMRKLVEKVMNENDQK